MYNIVKCWTNVNRHIPPFTHLLHLRQGQYWMNLHKIYIHYIITVSISLKNDFKSDLEEAKKIDNMSDERKTIYPFRVRSVFKRNGRVLGHRSQRLQWPIVITRCPASVVCRLSSVVRRPSSVVRRPSSVVRLSSVRLFTFSTSSPEPLDGFWWNLVWMKYSRSLTSVVVFRPDPSRGGSRAGQK